MNSLIIDQLLKLPDSFSIFKLILQENFSKNKTDLYNKMKDKDLVLDIKLNVYNIYHQINYKILNQKYLEKFDN